MIRTIITEVADSERDETRDDNTGSSHIENRAFSFAQETFLLEKIKDLQHYRDLRNKYAGRVFVFMCVWCAFVFVIIILDALTYTPPQNAQIQKDLSFQLSPPVLTTLIGGTTISVIGLVGFMMQGLFRSNGFKDTKDNNTK